MVEIKLIQRGNVFPEKIFLSIGDVVQFFRERWVHYPMDYLLIINGRSYNWPTAPFNLFELIDHIKYCVDLDKAFYGTN